MSELQGILEREARRVSAAPGALDAVLHRADRRRRNRRLATTIFALALAALAVSTLVRAFERSELKPALPPTITEENASRLRMAWTAAEPGGCCPTATVSDDHVFVGGRKGLSAYPIGCGTDGDTCQPLWFGAIDHVRHYLTAPVVGDGIVVVADRLHVYAFPVDCAGGGGTCRPSWVASPPTHDVSGPAHPYRGEHINAITPPAVGNGLVFAGSWNETRAYPADCRTDPCEPVWVGPGGGIPAVVDGALFASDRHHVYAWSTDCIASGGSCDPLWFAPVRAVVAWPSPPAVSDGVVYFGVGHQLLGFPVGCATDGSRCNPIWIGNTEEPLGRVLSWAIDEGIVFVGATTTDHLYQGAPGDVFAFPARCGDIGCDPIWTARLDGDPWLTARNGVLFAATYGGSFFAYPSRCSVVDGACRRIWMASTFDHGLIFDHVTMNDSTICAASDKAQVYCFSVPPDAHDPSTPSR
jgi:outer membrane protein assembly factor BamB